MPGGIELCAVLTVVRHRYDIAVLLRHEQPGPAQLVHAPEEQRGGNGVPGRERVEVAEQGMRHRCFAGHPVEHCGELAHAACLALGPLAEASRQVHVVERDQREGDTDEARRREASLPQRIDAAQRQRGEEEDDDRRRQDREPAENREEQPAEAPEHHGSLG